MIVVKAGGGEGIRYESVCDELAALHRSGQQPILVHGGSHLTNQLARQLGHEPRFVTSPGGFTSRFTDARTMEIFLMAYCGQTNKQIVEALQKRGINAIGLSGLDGRLWVGRQKPAIRVIEQGKTRILRGNLTGTVATVNCNLLHNLLDAGLLPVLCPPAITADGLAINVDGDRAAALTAVQMKAPRLIILSNVPGLMKDIADADSLISQVRRADLDEISQAFAAGRMKIKLLAAATAIDGGVGEVMIADARPDHCISRALEGHGTCITN
jgi:acetylglutamate/LysW-gamma-L-alpha-aminoadipate kinase